MSFDVASVAAVWHLRKISKRAIDVPSVAAAYWTDHESCRTIVHSIALIGSNWSLLATCVKSAMPKRAPPESAVDAQCILLLGGVFNVTIGSDREMNEIYDLA